MLRLEALEVRSVPATLTVTTVADDTALASLRAAITSINNGSDANPAIAVSRTGVYGTDDTILFAIPGTGVQTIALGTALPTMTKSMTIDGYSQPGASPNSLDVGSNANLLVALDGSGAGTVHGLTVAAPRCTIRGLVIQRFSESGVQIEGAEAAGNQVAGNFIGTNAEGNALLGNRTGVFIGSGATSNVVGGPTPRDRNLILGNGFGVRIAGGGTTGNLVAGNLIGTNANGDPSLGNVFGVIVVEGASGNTVGGTTSGTRNFISGNGIGVQIEDVGTRNNLVVGNFIGTKLDGNAARANEAGVVIAKGATNNTVGGTTPGTRNLISGNIAGVRIEQAGTSGNQVVGNFIGTNADGNASLGNRIGVLIEEGATNNIVGGTTPGAGNLITHNAKGVVVGADPTDDRDTFGNRVLGNQIFANTTINIDLGNDGPTPNGLNPRDFPNRGQNKPILTSVVGATVTASLDSTPNSNYRIEFFADSDELGQTFLGFFDVTTDGGGHGSLQATFATSIPTGAVITATATNIATGDSSEFASAVKQAIVIRPDIVPVGTVNTPYQQTLVGIGGRGGPYTFAVVTGVLPDGLTLDRDTGLISGIPTAHGSFDFTVTATDSLGDRSSRPFSVTIHPAIQVTPDILPELMVDRPVSLTANANGGGGGPYTFTITAGALPSGLTFDARNGLIRGNPTTAGRYQFTVTATAAAGGFGSKSYSGTVQPTQAQAPVVSNIFRLGSHGQRTRLILNFSAPLDPRTAQDLSNYSLVVIRRSGRTRPIRLAKAVYHAADRTVILTPTARKLNGRRTYQLRVNGSTSTGLASPAGIPLDGLGNGLPGSDYIRRFALLALTRPKSREVIS